MALLEMEGFDYGPGSNQMIGYTSGGLATKLNGNVFTWKGAASNIQATKIAGHGPIAGSAMQLPGGAGANANGPFPGATYATLIMGFSYQTSTLTATTLVAGFADTFANVQVGIAINSAMQPFLYRGTTATVIATSTRVLMFGATYYFELKVTFGAAGSYDFRIDGVTDLSSGSANTISTANSYATGVKLDSSIAGAAPSFDHFYLLDNTGPAPLNNFLASPTNAVCIETLFVTANHSVAFTPLSSTNASNVDETNQDQGTTYNSSSVSGDIDLFTHAALSSVPTTVYAVQVVAVLAKDDVTPQTGRTKMLSGAVTSNGPSSLLNTVYSSPYATYVTDPNTGVAWTGANVNASKIGYEHV